MDGNIKKFAFLCSDAAESGALRSVIFHSPVNKSSECLKIKGTNRVISGRRMIQLESHLTEGRLIHENIQTDAVSAHFMSLLDGKFRRADLVSENGSAALMISKKGDKASLVVHGRPAEATGECALGNNREKKRLLKGDEGFLAELGISDKNGRVRDKMQAKFRQINRFCEYIAEAVSKLDGDGVVHVSDLCCGKSYLSFAAYHTITEVIGRECFMHCVDLKESVIEYCKNVAEKCGFGGMKFYCMDIGDFKCDSAPDIVISLHACDTATDAVIEHAIKSKAEVILSTPCCHHEMNNKLDCKALDFIAERPLLRQKLCSAATDALRLLLLEAAGYNADATELIDPENTPKNIMLRGVRRKHISEREKKEKLDRYIAAYKFMYGFEPDSLLLRHTLEN